MGRKYGLSFSWRRATGLSAAKGRLSRAIGIPLTRSGRQRKVGRVLGQMGSAVLLSLLASRKAHGDRGTTSQVPLAPEPLSPEAEEAKREKDRNDLLLAAAITGGVLLLGVGLSAFVLLVTNNGTPAPDQGRTTAGVSSSVPLPTPPLPHDPSSIVKKYGKPDRDVTRPERARAGIVTRTIDYRFPNVRLVFVPNTKGPPHEWKLTRCEAILPAGSISELEAALRLDAFARRRTRPSGRRAHPQRTPAPDLMI
jgi:hypothetical protein